MMTFAAKTVVVHGDDVSSGLAMVHATLDEALLLEANQRGYERRLEATPAHPPTGGGSLHWIEHVAALRTALVGRGWTIKDVNNCPLVMSPCQSVALMVMTGNEDTGRHHASPSNRAEKCAVLDEAIQRNYELFCADTGGTAMWVLLYHVDTDHEGSLREIRSELSLPAEFSRGWIKAWRQRIILRPLSDISVEPARLPSQDFDVPVERKKPA